MNISGDLIDFIDASPSCYHAVANLAAMLQGYECLREEDAWKIKRGGKYYVIRKDSSMIAFRVPKKDYTGLRITAAHSDSPCFKVKTRADMVTEAHYTRLNTEKYGGMNMAMWLDRPLSVAGRVIVKEGDAYVSRLLNIDRDLLLIPSVAIHMKRDINDGFKYDAQVDTLPLLGDETAAGRLPKLVAEAAGVAEEDVLGSDLFLYTRQKGCIWGASGEYISSRALDDLQCAYGTMRGFKEAAESADTLNLCCVFDNEEVGSLTGQGADSTFLADVLERINASLGMEKEQLQRAIAAGFMISADNAHAVHPNHPEYADPTNRPFINGGIVMKFHAGQKYTTDGVSEAMFNDVCRRAGVSVQTFTNKSNMEGGSTLGNLSNRHVSIRTVDIGLPQLSMHSSYETAGTKDTEDLVRAVKTFFE